jgi:hypothetical protein
MEFKTSRLSRKSRIIRYSDRFVEQIEIMKSFKTQLIILKIILKIARLDGCYLRELSARLNEGRVWGHAAVSVENGQKGKK